MRLLRLLGLCFLAACARPDEKEETARVVAMAGTETMVADDLEGVSEMAADSARAARKAINRWAEDALFYQEALQKLDKFESDVEKEVERYRRDLVGHIYASRLIDANLDTVISHEETETYYNEHRASFILKENIVKVYYLKVPVKSPALPKIKKLKGTVVPKEQAELRQLCLQNAESFFINDSTWLFLEEIRREIPVLKDQPDIAMTVGRTVEFTDDFYYYFLRIRDVKIKNTMSPLNFERTNIRKFILNARKAQLIRDYKRQILEKATASRQFVIY